MRIDVHQHFAPPAYLGRIRSLSKLTHGPTDLSRWLIDDNLRAMDLCGIDYAVASISGGGVWFGDDQNALELARVWNDAAHEICEKQGGRFGFFGVLPMPYQQGSIDEIERLRASRHVHGFSTFTNYDDVWLGADRYAAALDHLNDLGAIVFVHPAPVFGGVTVPGVRPQILEFPFDTTRAAVSLIRSGCLEIRPKLRFILAHGGGCAAYLLDRLDELDGRSDELSYAERWRSFYVDCALVSDLNVQHLLRRTASDHVLFGSDAPFASGEAREAAARFGPTSLIQPRR